MGYAAQYLAEYYHQLGTMVQAGVPVVSALRTMQRNAPRSLREPSRRMADTCQAGRPMHEAMQSVGLRFTHLDCRTLAVSENSGALDTGLFGLARYHHNRAVARRKITTASIFPAVILIAAVLISRAPKLVLAMVEGNNYGPADYWFETLGTLAWMTATGVMLWWAVRWLFQTPGLNVWFERFVRCLPVLGRLRFDYALSRWLTDIHMMLNAGMGVLPALEVAGRGNPSPMIRHAYEQMTPWLGGQMDVSEVLRQSDVFPDEIVRMWATGEQSGRLDSMLERLSAMYEERWRRSLEMVSAWLPRLAYAGVCVFIVFQIFSLLRPLIQMYSEALSW